MTEQHDAEKRQVHDFWNRASCGEDLYLAGEDRAAYAAQAEARRLFAAFSEVRITTVLTHGDLLESGAGQRHGGMALSLARRIWPRWLIRRFFPNNGLFMLISAVK